MINFIKLRKFSYVISGILVIATLFGLFFFGLKPGIDFVGGSLMELGFNENEISIEKSKEILSAFEIGEPVISQSGNSSLIIRMKDIGEGEYQEIIKKFKENFSEVEEKRFESIGPTIGQELKRKSIWAIILVVLGIAIYLAWVFRKVSYPVSSWKYSFVTIIALIHDVLIPTGFFIYFSYFKGLEIDSSFVVALLVVLGFSVHDTIVVLDRIREKLRTESNLEFGEIINRSVNETLIRSFNTSITLIFVLVALIIFGPPSLWSFTLILLIGTLAGTYSSIFLASPLVYDWYLLKKKK
jgi:preprotein translocase subunit SecF